VKQGSLNTYCHGVEIAGPSKVVYSPDKPLSCGAKVWIETESEVTLVGPVKVLGRGGIPLTVFPEYSITKE
jgi:hypothetical protein